MGKRRGLGEPGRGPSFQRAAGLKRQRSIFRRAPGRRDQDGQGHQAHHRDQAERQRLCRHLQDPREDCDQLLHHRQRV